MRTFRRRSANKLDGTATERTLPLYRMRHNPSPFPHTEHTNTHVAASCPPRCPPRAWHAQISSHSMRRKHSTRRHVCQCAAAPICCRWQWLFAGRRLRCSSATPPSPPSPLAARHRPRALSAFAGIIVKSLSFELQTSLLGWAGQGWAEREHCASGLKGKPLRCWLAVRLQFARTCAAAHYAAELCSLML